VEEGVGAMIGAAASISQTPINRLLHALANHGVRPSGSEKWTAKCPAHDDGTASLSVGVGKNGRAIVYCHAGCKPEAVLARVGLCIADLFADGGKRSDLKPTSVGSPTYYTWCDAGGEQVDRKVRQLMSDGSKKMSWEHVEDGKWKTGQSAKNTRPPLYRLPEVLAAPSTEVIHVVEGEKCTEALRDLGLVATTTGGADSKLTDDVVSYFEARRVVLWPDDDGPGAKHVAAHKAALAGVARSIRVVDRAAFRKYAKPGKDGGGDVADLIADLRSDGVSAEQIRGRVLGLVPGSKLRSLAIAVTDEWLRTPLPPREHLLTDRRTGLGAVDKSGTFLFAGAGGGGKSYATGDLALAVATGRAWYDLGTSGRSGRVLMLVAEDEADDLRRRLKRIADRRYPDAAVGNRIVILPLRGRMVSFVQQDRLTGAYGQGEGLRDLIDYVEAEREVSNAPFDLVIVDPISRFAGVSLDKDSAAATAFIDALDRLSDAAGGLVLGVAHTNKLSRASDKGAAEAADVRGSSGLIDGPRGVIQLAPEVDKHTKKPTGLVILSATKGNHVARWNDIVLRRGEGGVLEPLDEVDRALFEAQRKGQAPAGRQAARESESNARKDRQATAKVDRAARARAETRARKDAEAEADVLVVRQIMASGTAGRLRDLVRAQLHCGADRADALIARASASVPRASDQNPPHTPPRAGEALEAPMVPRAPVLSRALESQNGGTEAQRGTGGTDGDAGRAIL
jgi:RecA-family ATPase